jgi:O-antigen ligase
VLKFIPESLRPKILFAALLAAVGTIPLPNNLNSIALIIFVAACLIRQPWAEAKKRLRASRFWLLPIALFLWYCCTFFWDTSGGFTVKELERYTILLFVPVACAIIPKFSLRQLKWAAWVFVLVTTGVSLLCLIKSYIEYQQTHDYRVFYYQYLGEQAGLNAIFLSNFCLASITWILYFGYIERVNRRWHQHLVSMLACAFLLLMIFLLSSKLVIFLTVIIVAVFLLALGYMRGVFIKALLIMAVFIGLGVVAVSNLSYLRWRIYSTEFKKYSGPQDDNNGIAIRLFMWETAAELVREKPILGYGLRGARNELLNEYERRNFSLGVQGYYHSHNQYIESMLMAGLPALLLLLALIAAAIKEAIRRRNFLLLLIVCHFALQSVFEATFEVQHELVFYMFFIFLFYYHAPQALPAQMKKQN